MVNFTCNHCGESLQKPRVEKHYQSTACSRSGISVSCMDCFKDFKLEEYVAHIKCITEEERYSAKGSVHAVKKGEVKQSTWVAMVNSIIEEQVDAKPNVKSLLEMISKHDNIPRKQAKFVNFIKSMSGGRIKVPDINEVWALLEAHKNAAKEEAKKLEALKTDDSKISKSDNETDVQPEDASPKKEETGNEESPENKEAVLNGNSKKKNKKNKNKRKAETSEENTETTVPQKKKKLSENEENVANGVEGSNKKKKGKKNTEVKIEENGVKKSKKNKKGKKEENKEGKTDENEVVNGTNGVVKSKKNKKKKGGKVENGEAETNKSVDDKEEFRWKNAIMDVVNTNEKGLTKDKLREEVFKKYVAAKGKINDKPQLYKQYSKKIKKLLNIKFENNIVTTIV